MRIMYRKDNVPRMYIMLGCINKLGTRVLSENRSAQLEQKIREYADKTWPIG